MNYYQLLDESNENVGLIATQDSNERDIDLYYKKYVNEKFKENESCNADDFCDWLENHYFIKAMRIFVTEINP